MSKKYKGIDGSLLLRDMDFTVQTKPEDITTYVRKPGKWLDITRALLALPEKKCFTKQLPPGAKAPNTMKWGMKKSAAHLGYKGRIHFAVKDSILYVWHTKGEK